MTELQRAYLAKNDGESPRTRCMAFVDAYYRGTQYDSLPRSWDEAADANGQAVPFLQRRPSTVLPWPALIVDTFTRALWAEGRRPIATLKGAEGSSDDNVALAELIASGRLYRVMANATRRALTVGTGLIVWRLQDDAVHAEAWDAKYATPAFQPGSRRELQALDYAYPYDAEDSDGQPCTMWHRETITTDTWTVYHDVAVKHGDRPAWGDSTKVAHGLGHVPAVWFTVGERCGAWDGTGVYADVLGLLDQANYLASQAGRALHYSLDPQTVFIGASEVDVQTLQKTGATVWPLPIGADAKLLESNQAYVGAAEARLDYLKKAILDATAVCVNDPEKVKTAQSGAALEVLSAPMLARVSDLRSDVGDCALVPLLEQILRAGADAGPDAAPPRVLLHWGALSPSTPEDARAAVEAVTKAVDAGLLSRASGARYLAPHCGVSDVEIDQQAVGAEREEAATQLQDSAVLETIPIPSPTFQRVLKLRLAEKVLGPRLATPDVLKDIADELEIGITAEGALPAAA